MGRVVHIQNSLAGGEVSPFIDIRDDIEKYKDSVRTMVNWVPMPYGGAHTRSGLQYVAQTKASGLAYLIPFEYSTIEAYVIEAGNLYFRFYRDGGRIYDLTGAVTNVTNNAGACKITSAAHGLSTGNYVSVTGVLGVPGANGEWQITVNDANNFTLDTSVFTGAYTSGGTWFRPYEIATPYAVADIPTLQFAQSADTLYLAHGSYAPRKLTRTGHTSWTLSTVTFTDGPYYDPNLITPGSAKSTITITPSAATGAITLTASSALWVSTDVGRLVRLLEGSTWGYATITGYTSPTVVNATVVNTLTNTNAKSTWRLGAWGTTPGYPAVIGFYQQRLCWGASSTEPQRLWFSTTNSYEDMSPSATNGTVAQSDAVTYQLGSGKVNVIRWFAGIEKFFIGTVGEEFALQGAADAALSAANPPLVTSSSFEGSAQAPAVRVASQVLFIQRTGREVRSMKFDLLDDSFTTEDVSLVAEHLFRSNYVSSIVSQPRPDHTVWAVRDDGSWLSFTYYPREKVAGWALQQTLGDVKSIAVIAHTDGRSDQSWYVVERVIGGVTKRFVEIDNNAMAVDAGLVYTGVATSSVTGLYHLEGETVSVVGDGAVYDTQVVTNGSVTLEYNDVSGPAASTIYIGLPLTPNPKIVTLPPAYKDDKGTVRGRWKHWVKIWVSIFETMGLSINGKVLDYRTPADPMDAAPPLFTGEKPITNLGWSRDGVLTFEQTLPLRATLRGYHGDMDVGD